MSINEVEFKKMEGELLTICDAITSNERQVESIKSLMRNCIWHYRQRLDIGEVSGYLTTDVPCGTTTCGGVNLTTGTSLKGKKGVDYHNTK